MNGNVAKKETGEENYKVKKREKEKKEKMFHSWIPITFFISLFIYVKDCFGIFYFTNFAILTNAQNTIFSPLLFRLIRKEKALKNLFCLRIYLYNIIILLLLPFSVPVMQNCWRVNWIEILFVRWNSCIVSENFMRGIFIGGFMSTYMIEF